MLKTLALSVAVLLTAGVANAQETKMTDPIYEIAIQEVKPGMDAEWAERRAAFLELLGKREGNEKDWTLKAFFTFPEPGPNPVYVGLTRWSRMADFGASAEALMPTEEAKRFFETVNMQAFVQVSPADGKAFVLEDHINAPGQVLEVAVRTPKGGHEGEFDAARAGFFGRVAEQPGYIFDREFVTADGQRVVLIGWNSQAEFMTALGKLSKMPEMGAFFGIIDASAYQAAIVE